MGLDKSYPAVQSWGTIPGRAGADRETAHPRRVTRSKAEGGLGGGQRGGCYGNALFTPFYG